MDFPLGDMPEPLRQIFNVMEHGQQQRMVEDETLKLEVSNFIDSLTLDQAKSFLSVLGIIDAPEALHHVRGVVSGCLVWKHGVTMDGDDTPWSALTKDAHEDIPKDEQQFNDLMADAAKAENMDKYLLEEDFDPSAPTPYKCRNCGLGYVSIEDRMLRSPGKAGCKGCVHKEKFG